MAATSGLTAREFVAAVRRTLLRRAMVKGGEAVVVAVSGGPDSMALLHSLARLSHSLDLSLHVAHFDHRLRDGSAQDAAFVGDAARKLSIPATIRGAVSTTRPRGLSPEEAARESRLAFLEEVADATGADRIATGHTLDDQAETVLMRVLVGGGMRGLSGIRPVRGRFIRPLIDVRRAETDAFCKALRLRPRVDPSNEDPAFLRNMLRHEVIPPVTEKVNARLPYVLARMADILRDEDEYLAERASEALSADVAEGEIRIPLGRFGDLHPALQRRVLRALAPVEAEHIEAMRELALGGRTGSAVDFPGPLNARVEYGWLILGRAPEVQRKAPASVELIVPGETDLPAWGLRLRAWVSSDPPDRWPDGRAACVLDASRVPSPLRVRRPKPGDRFRPLGMRGTKKLGDFFTDEKVPRSARSGVPLVAGGDAIVWVIGYRPDDRFAVGQRTKRHLWLEAEKK
jgi:tRNA(Ile)-lysidine synthase